MTPSVSVERADLTPSLVDEWAELAADVAAGPFVGPGWIQPWRAAFGRGRLVIFVARHRGRLVGVLPLERHFGVLRSPTNAHTPVFDHIATDDEVTRALAERVLEHKAPVVSLGRLEAGGPLTEALQDCAPRHRYRTVTRTMGRSPYVVTSGGLAAYERRVSRNLRHDVERRTRRLSELGAVSLEICSGREELPRLLQEGLEVERRGWKGAQRTAIASRARTRDFYVAAARWAASCGWLRLAFLRLDGRPIAFQFDLQSADTYYSLKIGHEPAYERYSPGKVLAYNMVARAASAGLATYELLGVDEAWKRRFTAASRELVALHAFSSSPTGRLARSGHTYGRGLARRVPLAARASSILRR